MANNKKAKLEREIVRIDGSMTIYEVADIHKKFIQSIEDEKEVAIDLRGVTDCDASGIQILFSLLKTAEAKGFNVTLYNISEAVKSTAEQIGVEIDRTLDPQGG